jgi:hypothetical protein
LNRFLFLLNMEVARRLYKPENYSALKQKAKLKLDFDELPIGVAIAAMVRCIESNKTYSFADFIDGRYHIFTGLLNCRMTALKLILTEFGQVQLAEWLSKNPEESFVAPEDHFRKAIKTLNYLMIKIDRNDFILEIIVTYENRTQNLNKSVDDGCNY